MNTNTFLRRRRVLPCAAALALFALATPAARAADDIARIASGNPAFSTLAAALRAAGLTHTLSESGPFTVLAPTNDAFAKLPPQVLQALLRPENRETLKAILAYHVISGDLLQSNVVRLKDGAQVATLQGGKLTLRNKLAIRFNDSNVIRTDIVADNGVIHAIDTVLLPPGIALPGVASSQSDLLDTAKSAGFGTLVAAVRAAGLESTLRADGPFTVFAPTDAAFAKLGAANVERLLRPENRAKLRSILTYHVVPKKVPSSRIQQLGDQTGIATTANGAQLRLQLRGGRIFADECPVSRADIATKNGLIHVVDHVLMPPGMTLD